MGALLIGEVTMYQSSPPSLSPLPLIFFTPVESGCQGKSEATVSYHIPFSRSIKVIQQDLSQKEREKRKQKRKASIVQTILQTKELRRHGVRQKISLLLAVASLGFESQLFNMGTFGFKHDPHVIPPQDCNVQERQERCRKIE